MDFFDKGDFQATTGATDDIIVANPKIVEILERCFNGNEHGSNKLFEALGQGTYLIPVMPMPIPINVGENESGVQNLGVEFMSSNDSEGNQYLPLCTDKSSLDVFVAGNPCNIMLLSATDVWELLCDLEDFEGVAICSDRIGRDLLLGSASVNLIQSMHGGSQVSFKNETKKTTVVH
ncbi:MAG: hypothetical protein COC05_05480 [Gammaproteobacteria bacterium]|nr:MAG: hypothetical protein COC05_05480 [Gammaproteobacteria bacterium]